MTSIEWLIEQLQNTFSEYIKLNPDWEVLEQAKKMHNKETETLYTEEQMIEYGKFVAMMTSAATMDAEIAKLEHEQCFKLFLKQPKKD